MAPGSVAVIEAGAGHAFAEAALVEKILFDAPELLVEKVIGLVNEAHCDVGI